MSKRDRNRLRSITWLSSWRFKALSISLLILLAILLFNRPASISTNPASQHLTSRSRFTVLINTWKRYDLLERSVAHYSCCRGVDAIRVVWSESQAPSQELRAALLGAHRNKVGFRIDVNDEDDLNNRFKPLDGVATDAIFSIDDDILVPCSTLEFAFRVWLSAPLTMVGLVPRMHWASTKSTSKYVSHTYRPDELWYSYGGWWSVWWTGTYSMVLTKAAFLHHKYLEYYTREMPAVVREYVVKQRNCEDVAMSFMVANLTNAPPIWVKGKLYEIGSSGISSLKGHNYHRTVCLNYFTSLYGYMPLVPTNVKAIDANLDWLW